MRTRPSERAVQLRVDELASLWGDTPTAPVQVSLLLTVEPCGPDPVTADRLAGLIAARAAGVPLLRRRILRPDADRAAWVPDPSPVAGLVAVDTLDVPAHPDGPGCPGAVAAGDAAWSWAADRAVRPLPAERPPWRVLVAPAAAGPEGDGGGRVVVLVTAHHALVDGAQGLALVEALLGVGDAAGADHPVPPEAPKGPAGAPERPGRPGWRRLRARTATAGCVVAALAALRGREPGAGLLRAPGGGRCLDVVERPLDRVVEGARSRGATVTDAVLAAVAGGLHEVCTAAGPLDRGLVLRAAVPVAGPGAGQAAGLMVAPLPVGEPDPDRRLAAVVAGTAPVRARLRTARAAAVPARRHPGGRASRPPRALPRPVLALVRRALMRSRVWGERRTTAAVTVLRGPARPWPVPGGTVTGVAALAPLSDRVRVAVTAVSYAGTLTLAVHTGEGVDPERLIGPALGRSLDRCGPARPDGPDERTDGPGARSTG